MMETYFILETTLANVVILTITGISLIILLFGILRDKANISAYSLGMIVNMSAIVVMLDYSESRNGKVELYTKPEIIYIDEYIEPGDSIASYSIIYSWGNDYEYAIDGIRGHSELIPILDSLKNATIKSNPVQVLD